MLREVIAANKATADSLKATTESLKTIAESHNKALDGLRLAHDKEIDRLTIENLGLRRKLEALMVTRVLFALTFAFPLFSNYPNKTDKKFLEIASLSLFCLSFNNFIFILSLNIIQSGNPSK